MVHLAREITTIVVSDYGPEELLRRLSDPFWFQSFGCVLGFDWHSSGVTTTLCGALKEGIRGIEKELGFFVAGGKGRTSRKTPEELENWGQTLSLDAAPLIYASRMSAKVDTSAIQDGYQLYHHTFCFTGKGSWAVVQQGMNDSNNFARRYHWLSEKLVDFVNEPHAAVEGQNLGHVLNLTAGESQPARDTIAEIVRQQKPEDLLSDIKRLPTLALPARHRIEVEDLHPDSIAKILLSSYERQPENFEKLLGLQGVGPKTIRALSLISELVHGVAPSYRDPARYSFAHGGKDGIPYPVDRPLYDQSIVLLARAIDRAKISPTDKSNAHRRLSLLGLEG